jgi:limonene-1,2-epoxide hydrolase
MFPPKQKIAAAMFVVFGVGLTNPIEAASVNVPNENQQEKPSMIEPNPHSYGRSAENLIGQAREPGIAGARALLETFYHAFNRRDLALLRQVWAEHDLIQLNNPLGGVLRGYEPIAELYGRVFSGPVSVWVEFYDIVEFAGDGMVVFAGRERGEFTRDGAILLLAIRTTRIVRWLGEDTGWRQVHHHGSIDDPALLSAYRKAVGGA